MKLRFCGKAYEGPMVYVVVEGNSITCVDTKGKHMDLSMFTHDAAALMFKLEDLYEVYAYTTNPSEPKGKMLQALQHHTHGLEWVVVEKAT